MLSMEAMVFEREAVEEDEEMRNPDNLQSLDSLQRVSTSSLWEWTICFISGAKKYDTSVTILRF